MIFYLIHILKIIVCCPFSSFEEGLLQTNIETIEKTISLANLEETFSFGIWSCYQDRMLTALDGSQQLILTINHNNQPILEFSSQFQDVDQSFVVSIKLYDINLEFQVVEFRYYYYDYQEKWIFTLMNFDNELKDLIISMTDQEEQILKNLNLLEQDSTYEFIEGTNENTWWDKSQFNGRLSKILFFENYIYSTNSFNIFSDLCKIPVEQIVGEQIISIISGLLIFENNQMIRIPVPQTGKNYCINGWVKHNIDTLITETFQVLFRIGLPKKNENQKSFGDNLFKLSAYLSLEQKSYSKMQLIINAYCKLYVNEECKSEVIDFYSIQSYYEIYYFYFSNNLLFEGLTQWHYFQYEYGRKLEKGIGLLFQVQFQNELGLYTLNLTDLRRGSRINNLFYMYIGEKFSDNDELYASYYNLNFFCNYEEELDFIITCHFSCQTCNGPLETNCLTCFEFTHRVFDADQKRCNCEEGYIQTEENIALCQNFQGQFPFYEIKQVEDVQSTKCKLGYYNVPNQYQQFQCFQCPQQSLTQILCVDCWMNQEFWYQYPVCSQDLLNRNLLENEDYFLLNRKAEDIDIYIIDKNYDLLYLNGYQGFCESKVNDINCFEISHLHLQKKVKGFCKPNFIYANNDCQFGENICPSYDTNTACKYCDDGFYLIDGKCLPCPNNCEKCSYNQQDLQVQCDQCKPTYGLQNNMCQKCGTYCLICQQTFSENFDKNILECLKCIDVSKYFISIDKLQCLENKIEGCKYVMQVQLDDNCYWLTELYYGNNVEGIVDTCSKCQNSVSFNSYTNVCESDSQTTDFVWNFLDCKFLIKSVETIDCIQSKSAFTKQQCSNNVQNCEMCYDENMVSMICIQCKIGYYANRLTGQCFSCPQELNCLTCGQQQILSQDYYIFEISPYIDHFFSNFRFYYQSQNIFDYEIFCLTCQEGFKLINGKCIKGCSKDCQECELIDSRFQCVKCFRKESDRLFTIVNNECLECPENCDVCLPRNQGDQISINPFFNDSKFSIYSNQCLKSIQNYPKYYDQFLRQFINCDQIKECQNQLVVKLNLICTQEEYQNSIDELFNDKEQLESFLQKNIFIDDLFTQNNFPQLYNDQFYKFINSNQIKKIIIIIDSSKEQSCLIAEDSTIQQKLQNHIFSLQQVELRFNFSNPINIIYRGQIKILDFDQVYFTNINFISAASNNIKQILISSLKFQQIVFNQVRFLQESLDQYQTNILVQNLTLLEIDNVTIQSFKQNISNNFFKVAKQIQSKIIRVQNFQIFDSNFKNQIIFFIELNQNDEVIFENIHLESIFDNTAFIENKQNLVSQNFVSQNQTNIGKILITNFKIQSSIFHTQYFLNLNLFSKALFKNSSIFNSQFINSSLINLCNNQTIADFIIQKSILKFNSSVLKNAASLSLFLDCNFLNLLFDENQYDQYSNFIKITNPFDFDYNMKFQNLKLQNNQGTNKRETFRDYKITLIFLEASFVMIENLQLIKGFGLRDFMIMNTKSFQLYDSSIELGQKFQQLLIHQNLDCTSKFIQSYSYVEVISLYSVQNTHIKNIVINNLQLINFSAFTYKSTEIELKKQNEIFQIEKMTIKNTLLIQTDDSISFSIIQIKSSQQIVIKFLEVNCENNMLHSYSQNYLETSSSLIYIDCYLCDIEISSAKFISNFLTNSTNSIIFINSNTILISDCLFQFSNQFQFETLKNYFIFGFQSDIIYQKNVEAIFPIISSNGNGLFVGEKIQLINVQIHNSIGQNGGGFSFISKQHMLLELNNIIVNNISTLFTQKIENGGVFNIDGSQAQSLQVHMQNVTSQNIFCQNQGGFIFLKPGNSRINIHLYNLYLKDIYSAEGSLMYVQFSGITSNQQILEMRNITLRNSQEGFQYFLSKYGSIQQDNIFQIIENRVIIYCEFGSNIILNNIIVENLIYEGFVILKEIQEAGLINIQANDSKFLYFFIELKLFQNLQKAVIIKNVIIQNVTQFASSASNTICLQKLQSIPVNNQICPDLKQYFLENDSNFVNLKNSKYFIQMCLELQLSFRNIELINGLMTLENLNDALDLRMANLLFQNINCEQCQKGLLYLYWSQETNEFSNNKNISKIVIILSECGKKGCINFESQATSNLLSESVNNQVNETEIQISEAICLNNTATIGTCLKVSNMNILINNSTFQNNHASVSGGAIQIEGLSIAIIQNCHIKFNVAVIGGGVYFDDIHQINYERLNNIIYDNKANYSEDNFKAPPDRLRLQLQKDHIMETRTIFQNETHQIDEAFINNNQILLLPSGQPLGSYKFFKYEVGQYENANIIFRIQALQFDQVKSSNLDNSICKIQSRQYNSTQDDDQQPFTDNFTNINQIVYDSKIQEYSFDDLILYFDDKAHNDFKLQLQISCNSIRVGKYSDQYPFQLQKELLNYSIRVNLRTLPCQFGEIKNLTDYSCHLCDSIQGYFSLTLDSSKCEQKDDLTILDVQPALLKLRENYWRPYFDSTEISLCYNLYSNCQGGWVQGDASCTLGHIGALCEQCDVYNTRGDGQYAISKKYECGSCTDQTRNTLLLVFTILWTLITLFFSVQGNVKILEEFSKPNLFFSKSAQLNLCQQQAGILIKMLTNYFQIIVSLSTFQLNLPLIIDGFLNVAGNPMQTTANTQDCFLIDVFTFSIEYSRVVWLLMMPFFYLAAFLLIYKISSFLQKININVSVISTSILYIYVYFQPNITGNLMLLLSYRKISGYVWVKANVARRYDTQFHIDWMLQLALPIFIIVAFVLPLLIFCLLQKNKHKLNQKQVRVLLGYLYHEYKTEAYYWEIVKLLQKEMIIIVLNFYEDNIVEKGVLTLLITFVYSQLNKFSQPYQLKNLNNLDVNSTNICTFSIALAIGIYVSNQSDLTELKILFWVTLGFLNIRFIVSMIFQIVLEYIKNFESLFYSIVESVGQQFPALKSNSIFIKIKQRKQKQIRVRELYKKLQQYLIPSAKSVLQHKHSINQLYFNNMENQINTNLRRTILTISKEQNDMMQMSKEEFDQRLQTFLQNPSKTELKQTI